MLFIISICLLIEKTIKLDKIILSVTYIFEVLANLNSRSRILSSCVNTIKEH